MGWINDNTLSAVLLRHCPALAPALRHMKNGTGTFGYLVEACDPCEADNYGYSIQGVAVSDFITPHFYDPIPTPGTRYSFTGAIPSPRQILPGGYISWVDPGTDEWQQLRYLDPNRPPTIVDLGPPAGRSLREWVDAETAKSHLTTTLAISRHPSNQALLRRSKENRARWSARRWHGLRSISDPDAGPRVFLAMTNGDPRRTMGGHR